MNIGLGQIIIIVIIMLLLWGNFPQLLKNVSTSLNEIFEMFKKDSEQNKKNHKKDEKKLVFQEKRDSNP